MIEFVQFSHYFTGKNSVVAIKVNKIQSVFSFLSFGQKRELKFI
jgi:hypothetical protein